jgi:hypothetical protein
LLVCNYRPHQPERPPCVNNRPVTWSDNSSGTPNDIKIPLTTARPLPACCQASQKHGRGMAPGLVPYIPIPFLIATASSMVVAGFPPQQHSIASAGTKPDTVEDKCIHASTVKPSNLHATYMRHRITPCHELQTTPQLQNHKGPAKGLTCMQTYSMPLHYIPAHHISGNILHCGNN